MRSYQHKFKGLDSCKILVINETNKIKTYYNNLIYYPASISANKHVQLICTCNYLKINKTNYNYLLN